MSWSSDAEPEARRLTGRPLLVVLAVATVLVYALSQAPLVVVETLVRHGWFNGDLGFLLLNTLGFAATGACVAVSVVTRLPGAATGVALVVWLLDGVVHVSGPFRSGVDYHLFPLLVTLCLLGADTVLLVRRLRPATPVIAALSGVVVAVLVAVLREVYVQLTLSDQLVRVGGAADWHINGPMVAACVVGGLVGWAVGRLVRSRSGEPVAVG